jgi:hypothetical protein
MVAVVDPLTPKFIRVFWSNIQFLSVALSWAGLRLTWADCPKDSDRGIIVRKANKVNAPEAVLNTGENERKCFREAID